MDALVLCAGIPRSGSTWLFNAVRLLLEHAGRGAVYGAWVTEYDPSRAEPQHVVKLHVRKQPLVDRAAHIFTSRRDLRDIVASAWLRGWIGNQRQALRFARRAVRFHDYWTRLAHEEFVYESVRSDPREALRRIARRLQVAIGDRELATLAGTIDAIPDPGATLVGRHDPVTLMNREHRRHGGSYYAEVLPPRCVELIEREFGGWLGRYGYVDGVRPHVA